MSDFRNKFNRFMVGRYGMDEFGKFLYVVGLVLAIVGIFIRYVWIVALLVIAYNYFRMFSRNIAARTEENQRFCKFFKIKRRSGGYNQGNTYSQRGQMTNEQKKALDKKTHKIFKCPNCSQKVRVPKGKGRISIRCPKCRIEFIKKT